MQNAKMQPIVTDVQWLVCLSVCVCVCLSPNHDTCATTAEPIKTPFGAWTWVGRRNHGEGPDTQRVGDQIPQGKRYFL